MSKLYRQLADRVRANGDTSPGQLNLIADILSTVSHEAGHWTNRADDATRIPDMIYDASREFRAVARAAGGES